MIELNILIIEQNISNYNKTLQWYHVNIMSHHLLYQYLITFIEFIKILSVVLHYFVNNIIII
jgi:hypothetical protein